MKPEYTPDELLPLSGIQHFLFCRRQWALIHVERSGRRTRSPPKAASCTGARMTPFSPKRAKE
jgi:hypothetical protein